MTEVDEIPEIPSLEDTNDNILDVDGAVEEVIEDKALSPLKSVSKPTKHEVQEDPQVEEEVEEQLLQPIDTSSHQSTRVDSPSPEVVEEEVPPADSHLHDTQPATHEDIFEIFDQDHPKSSRKMDKEVISSPRKENSNHNSGTNSPVTSGKKKMVIKSDSPHRRKVDEDDDNHHKSPTTSPVKKLSLHDDKVVIEMTASDIAEEAVKSARDSLEKKKEDVPESASNDVTPPNTLEEHAKSSHPTGSSATPSPMKKKKVPSPSPVKEIQSQKEKEVMAEEAEKIALQAKQSRLNAQKELKEHRLQQRKQQLSLLAKEKKEKENDEQSKDGVSKEPVKEKKSGIPRRKSNPAPKAAASTEPNPTEGQEDGQIKLPAIAAKPVQSSAQRLQRRINAARDKSDVNKASLPAGRRSAEKLPRLVQVSKDDSHEEDNGDERDHEEGNGHGKRPPRSSPDGGGETVTKKKKPLYLRMIAKAQKKIVEEERKKVSITYIISTH